MNLYPLKLVPIFKAKVWGGRQLDKLGKRLPPDEPIGESWELVDLGVTSASGGGGGAERSIIANGPMTGRTLHDLIDQFGPQLLGNLKLTDQGGFPILVKFLDARQNLSVQVHPDAAYVAGHPDAYLKSEAWYVLDAEPGAVIYKGVRDGVTPDQFRAAINDNTVEQLLIEVPVQPGDCHYLPSGTCHALGAGIVVAEVQTPSDTTFRVYDWGRTGRQLHVEQALQCIHFGPADTAAAEQPSRIEGPHSTVTRLCRCDYFRIERIDMADGQNQPVGRNQPTVWMVLSGRGRITCTGCDDVPFVPGDTILMPQSLHDPHVATEADTTWLEVTFPQAAANLIA